MPLTITALSEFTALKHTSPDKCTMTVLSSSRGTYIQSQVEPLILPILFSQCWRVQMSGILLATCVMVRLFKVRSHDHFPYVISCRSSFLMIHVHVGFLSCMYIFALPSCCVCSERYYLVEATISKSQHFCPHIHPGVHEASVC